MEIYIYVLKGTNLYNLFLLIPTFLSYMPLLIYLSYKKKFNIDLNDYCVPGKKYTFSKFWKSDLFIISCSGWQTLKGQTANILDFIGYTVCVATTQLWIVAWNLPQVIHKWMSVAACQ